MGRLLERGLLNIHPRILRYIDNSKYADTSGWRRGYETFFVWFLSMHCSCTAAEKLSKNWGHLFSYQMYKFFCTMLLPNRRKMMKRPSFPVVFFTTTSSQYCHEAVWVWSASCSHSLGRPGFALELAGVEAALRCRASSRGWPRRGRWTPSRCSRLSWRRSGRWTTMQGRQIQMRALNQQSAWPVTTKLEQ